MCVMHTLPPQSVMSLSFHVPLIYKKIKKKDYQAFPLKIALKTKPQATCWEAALNCKETNKHVKMILNFAQV